MISYLCLKLCWVVDTWTRFDTLSGESRCGCVQLRVPCRIQEVGAACVLVGVYTYMVSVEVAFHKARFCVSRNLVVIPLGFERTLQADWRQCFWRVPVLSAVLHPTLEGAVECSGPFPWHAASGQETEIIVPLRIMSPQSLDLVWSCLGFVQF